MSSWSSLECSPPCQGGDRGFKSRRGRLSGYVTVRKPEKRPSSNLGELFVGSTPTRATRCFASAGHWRAQVAVTHPPSGIAGSTPARRTALARSSIGSGRRPLKPQGRVRFPHGSLNDQRPSGVTGKHATLRTSCLRWRGSSTLPLVIQVN